MTPELWILLWTAALQWALILVAATPRLLINGIPWSLGNRETPAKEVPPWAARLQKASDNLAENLILFAIVVLVVHAAGTSNSTSLLGAQIFLGARIAHAGLYTAGVSTVRTVAWAVSLGGIAMMGSTLF